MNIIDIGGVNSIQKKFSPNCLVCYKVSNPKKLNNKVLWELKMHIFH